MQVFVASFLLVLLQIVEAMHMAIICTSNDDCGEGETCVAGDAEIPVQNCVAGVVCGGSLSGSCPSDVVSGQLACLRHEGIYKCLSVDRCDAYFGGSFCSDECNVNGVQCNGKGSCSVVSTSSDGAPRFGCTCIDGVSGDMCDFSSGSSSASHASSSFSSTSSSDAEDSDSSTNFSLPLTSLGSLTLESLNGSGSFSSSVDGSMSSSSSSSTDELMDVDSGDTPGVATQSSGSGSAATDSDTDGTSSAVFIVIGLLAVSIVVGALIFAMYSRKRKREQEADAIGGPVAVESDIIKGTGADTPKSSIVTM